MMSELWRSVSFAHMAVNIDLSFKASGNFFKAIFNYYFMFLNRQIHLKR
jgi:hypothetical protein